jgi:hypothetical protein
MKYDVDAKEIYVNGRWIDVDDTEEFESTKVKRSKREVQERKLKKQKVSKRRKRW